MDYSLHGQCDTSAELFEKAGLSQVFQYRSPGGCYLSMCYCRLSFLFTQLSASSTRIYSTCHLFIQILCSITCLCICFYLSSKCKNNASLSKMDGWLMSLVYVRSFPFTMNSRITASIEYLKSLLCQSVARLLSMKALVFLAI